MNTHALVATLLLLASPVTTAFAAGKLPEPTAGDYLLIAQMAAEQKDWAKAEEILRGGLAKHPASDGFHLSLGYVLREQGRTADAFYEYQWEMLRSGNAKLAARAAQDSAQLLEGSDAGAAEARAVMDALALAPKDPAVARKKLAEISAMRGDRFALRVYEAECAQMAADRVSAEASFRALLVRDPSFVPGYVSLARLLRSSGRGPEADTLLAKARAIDARHWALGADMR